MNILIYMSKVMVVGWLLGFVFACKPESTTGLGNKLHCIRLTFESKKTKACFDSNSRKEIRRQLRRQNVTKKRGFIIDCYDDNFKNECVGLFLLSTIEVEDNWTYTIIPMLKAEHYVIINTAFKAGVEIKPNSMKNAMEQFRLEHLNSFQEKSWKEIDSVFMMGSYSQTSWRDNIIVD